MPAIKPNSMLFEVNTRTYLRRINKKYNSTFKLITIPDDEWKALAEKGFNEIWLMGVWQHSPTALRLSLQNPCLHQEYNCLLPQWNNDDIAASAYAIYDYSLDSEFGDEGDLSILKEKLNSFGLKVILDFIPNHVAADHPWVRSHPDWFIRGNKRDIESHPDWFFTVDGSVHFAYGRDPNFPPWIDTAQLNYYSMELRQVLIKELIKVAAVADGVRCDMAMLLLNDIFQMVWGDIARDDSLPQIEFWEQAISGVKQLFPDFTFIAEAYWGKEQKLQQLGFDFTYDKTLYDRLRYNSAGEIVAMLISERHNLSRCLHFLENHDEPRSCSIFGKERSMAAAVVVATLPGIRFYFDGQLEGRRIHTPIQLATEPAEPVDVEIARFYDRLLGICNSPVFKDGDWMLLKLNYAWADNESYENLMAWCWQYQNKLKVVVINYSDSASQSRLLLPQLPQNMNRVVSYDELADAVYESSADEVRTLGLYIALQPWQSHILDIVLNTAAE